MAAVAGLRGTGDWGPDELPKNFREFILWRNPNGTAPLTALMARVGKESTNHPEFSWWDEPVDLVRVQVDGNHAAAATTITIKSLDPDADNPRRNWGSALHLVPGDILLVELAAETEVFDRELLVVTAVNSATEIEVQRSAAGSEALAGGSSIPNNAWLLKIGSAFAEGTRAPVSASRNPIKYTNFTQIFKTTYELTRTAAGTEPRTGDPIANDRKRKAWDHARDLEFAFLFGRKHETVGANGKPLRYTDGLRRFIPASNTTIFTDSIDIHGLLDAVSVAFDFDSPAGDQRIALAGNGALNAINKMVQSDAGVRVQYGGRINVYGMVLRELIFPQGSLFIRTHPMMNRHAKFTNSMFIVDFSALRYRPFRGADTKFKDNVQHNDEDTRKGLWLTEAGLEVRYGGLTCAYLGNVTFALPG